MAELHIPWGVWGPATGRWRPNIGLTALGKSIRQQHQENVAHGFSCRHMYQPSRCPICNQLRSTGRE